MIGDIHTFDGVGANDETTTKLGFDGVTSTSNKFWIRSFGYASDASLFYESSLDGYSIAVSET